jgi:hypothetical protein
MPLNRKYPRTGLSSGETWWNTRFSSGEKVAVWWPSGPNSVTVVGYYDTVSAGNAAAVANRSASGAYPHVLVNFYHPDFSRKSIGAISHRLAQEDFPSWYDEDPEY